MVHWLLIAKLIRCNVWYSDEESSWAGEPHSSHEEPVLGRVPIVADRHKHPKQLTIDK